MSNIDKPHFLARKIQDFQRSTARGYICPVCSEAFQQEPKLWQHAKDLHSDALDYRDVAGEAEARKKFRQEAIDRAQKTSRRSARSPEIFSSKPSSKDDASTRPHVGDEIGSSSPSRPTSAPAPLRDPEKEIHKIDKLTINKDLSTEYMPDSGNSPLVPHNPLKRGAGAGSGPAEPLPGAQNLGKISSRARHLKTLSGDPFIGRDPDFDREVITASDPTHQRKTGGFAKRLFDPNTDDIGLTPLARNDTQHRRQEHPRTARRANDPKSQTSAAKKTISDARGSLQPRLELDKESHPPQPFTFGSENLEDVVPLYGSASADQSQEYHTEHEPVMIPQPETKPISHDQLVVEVKGIYAGLVMVEAKCIEVDENQPTTAQGKDVSRNNKLSNEQWQALIALHKQLLHEHHDFFLASQHPSASPTLSRLAAKYSMPARMWRHGIHAFLEVLRHRLPESLDHMLAFIYIAYSMMALLYETVPTFEDTWIECLGDLARYRMAIEDDDIKDREIWSGVARFWYSKAADKSPKVGRLYHHLAILARPSSLQQLSLYAKSLTCIIPFESARGSITAVFTPKLNGKDSAYHRTSSLEGVFITCHGFLFTGKLHNEFSDGIRQLKDGLLDTYIGRVTAKFKEQGVFIAVTNIAALFEYGATKQRGIHKSIFRLAYDEVDFQGNQRPSPQFPPSFIQSFDANANPAHPSHAQADRAPPNNLTASDLESSELVISHASAIAFLTLSISLQRFGDKNVLPLIHVSFVFLWSLAVVEKAMKYVERDIPWGEICSYLNILAKPVAMTPRVWGEGFPKSSDGISRPLPEDFVLRGQVYSQGYLPQYWFQEAMVDDEERSLELPSMAAPRVERILWLGMRIASFKRWIRFSKESHKFEITQYGLALQNPQQLIMKNSSGISPIPNDRDITMSDLVPRVDPLSAFSSPKIQVDQHPVSKPLPLETTDTTQNEKDVMMIDSRSEEGQSNKRPHSSPKTDPLSWLSAGSVGKEHNAPLKKHHQAFISDPSKLEAMVDFDTFEAKDPFKI